MLEIPLQPLCDNLDTYTYEVFETDPVKYKLYQDAVQAALLDRVSAAEAKTKLVWCSSPPIRYILTFVCSNLQTVVMLLGGGRGPLARAVFNASELTKRKVRLYIIEKNPNAIRTLSNMVKTLWADKGKNKKKKIPCFNPVLIRNKSFRCSHFFKGHAGLFPSRAG